MYSASAWRRRRPVPRWNARYWDHARKWRNWPEDKTHKGAIPPDLLYLAHLPRAARRFVTTPRIIGGAGGPERSPVGSRPGFGADRAGQAPDTGSTRRVPPTRPLRDRLAAPAARGSARAAQWRSYPAARWQTRRAEFEPISSRNSDRHEHHDGPTDRPRVSALSPSARDPMRPARSTAWGQGSRA